MPHKLPVNEAQKLYGNNSSQAQAAENVINAINEYNQNPTVSNKGKAVDALNTYEKYANGQIVSAQKALDRSEMLTKLTFKNN